MKRNLKYSFIIFFNLLLCTYNAQSQDLRFSQYFNSPLSTNPANTGFITSSDYRVGGHFRDQWAGSPGSYKTSSLYGDFQFMRNAIPSGWFGVGGLILQDVAGRGALVSNKVYTSLAYHQMIGVDGLLSAGFNLGYANKRVNLNNLSFGDQWNGRFFDQSKSSIEWANLQQSSIGYFDMQVGLNYAYFPTDNLYIHGGASLHHLNRPRETFFSTSVVDTRLSPRSIFFTDAIIKLNNLIIINPGIYFTQQAKAYELVAGMHFNLNVSGDGKQQLLGGAYLRKGNAFIPMVGYQWKSFKFMFSYDATMGDLSYYGTGANEFNLQYDGIYTLVNRDRQSMCPAFDR